MRLAAAFLALVFASAPASAGESVQPRAVVELFTSQGCSSCVAADGLIAKLAEDPAIIALTLPIDYWDYLGWKDTLGSAALSARQRAYAMAHGSTKVFTPQIVVSGLLSDVAKNEGAVMSAIEASRSHPEVLSINVRIVEHGDRLDVHAYPKSGDILPGEVWVLATAKKRTVQVDGGENAGRALPYVNVVRKMTRLGPCDGKVCRFSISRTEALGADGDGLVVLVQEGSGGMPGAILGAAKLQL